jgi:hypothetical protein
MHTDMQYDIPSPDAIPDDPTPTPEQVALWELLQGPLVRASAASREYADEYGDIEHCDKEQAIELAERVFDAGGDHGQAYLAAFEFICNRYRKMPAIVVARHVNIIVFLARDGV